MNKTLYPLLLAVLNIFISVFSADAADNGGEFCEEYTDANESGEYSEDGLTGSYGDGYVSNRYEPSTSGTFVMDGGSEED